VSYGDQYQVLGFRDLIDVKSRGEGEFDVALRNPEYDLTRTVRKVLTTYQGGASPFATLTTPLTFTGYVSAGSALPANLAPARAALEQALDKLRGQAGAKLKVEFKDPGTDAALAKRLAGDEGLRPLVAGLLDPRPFWFHLALSDGKQQQRVPLPQPLDQDGFKRSLEAAIKRFSPGFQKSVAVLSNSAPEGAMPGQFQGGGAQHGNLREALGQSVSWLDADLRDGQVPAAADMLLVLGPENLDEKRVFAIDQFLMQGGSVVIATAPTSVTLSRSIDARPVQSGLEAWLAGHGVSVGKGLVLDPVNGALPIPVERPIGGGLSVREIQLAPYPYIVDVRGAGLDARHAVTASLGQLAVPWAAPVSADAEKNKARKITTLLQSSAQSWVSESLDLLPDYRRFRDLGFAPGEKRGANTLAVMIEGRFESAFKGKDSPLLQSAPDKPAAAALAAATAAAKEGKAAPQAPSPGAAASAPLGRVIDQSPESARLVVIGSAALFGDQAANLIGQTLGNRYLKPAEFAQNLVDWSLEDQGLLSIRSRGTFARTLAPLSAQSQAFWEYANYALALIGLVVVWAVHRWRRRVGVRRHSLLLQEA
jgi:ABC-2 type transport system permease protein